MYAARLLPPRSVSYQDRIDHINNDKELFCLIREQLSQRRGRGRIRNLFSCTSIRELSFVKVSTSILRLKFECLY